MHFKEKKSIKITQLFTYRSPLLCQTFIDLPIWKLETNNGTHSIGTSWS